MEELRVGDFIECFYNDNGSTEYVGQCGQIIEIDSNEETYGYIVNFSECRFGSHELRKLRTSSKVVSGQTLTSDGYKSSGPTFINQIAEDLNKIK